MFFRKKIAAPAAPAVPVAPAVAWDDNTTAHFAKTDRFDVEITSVGKRCGFGQTRPGEPMREPDSYDVSGVITFPKLVLVTLSFGGRDSEFGGWFYHLYSSGRKSKQSVPFLDMWITDSEGGIRRALYESHKAALLCGRRHSLARFWKRKGDGVMTEKDREHGYSYESRSRYPLIGLYTWAELESKYLPDWAVPYGTDRFSLENLPV
jgi:hypothetical protein